MDWNMKAASWDVTELDQATLANIETADGSSRFGVQRTTGEFSVDLKLGQVGNSGTEPVAKWKYVAGVSKVVSSPSGSSKRARAINNGTQTVSCLVDGCNSDLSNCRDYHRRHKVCELHSKTPEVTIGGHKQRFCQQCSRFHSLEEFDEGKRSCRKRLDGHNRRRRKQQPEAIARSGSFLSNYQGTQFLPFSSSHVYPSTAVVNPSWNGGATSCGDTRLHNQHQQMHLMDKQDLFLGSSSSSCYKEVKQLAFLQGDNSTMDNQNQTFLRSSPLSESEGFRSKIFCDGLTSPLHDRDSRCALSLLSSPQTHTPGNGLSQMVQPHSMSLMQQQQPLALSLPHNSLDSVDVEPVLVPHGSDHCPAMYNINEAPQPFPFLWE